MNEVVEIDPIYQIEPEHVWVRITNMETVGRFRVILELNGGARNGGHDRVLFDSINECDGMIGQHTNLTWLVRR